MRVALLIALAALAAAPVGAAARPASVAVAVDPGSPEPVRAAERTIRVDGRRCTVPENTPLAALLAGGARPGLRDFATCSQRARDASGLFVDKLEGRANRGQDGWVYKIATKLGTAGAGMHLPRSSQAVTVTATSLPERFELVCRVLWQLALFASRRQ